MLRDGPIPRFVHGFIEYAAAALFFAAPFVFSFDAGAAIAVSLIAGIVVLFLAASTEGPTSLINYVPLAAHVVLDYVLAVLLIAIPFIAGFSDETAPTVFFIAVGALHLLVTIGTRFKKDAAQPSRKRRRRRGRSELAADGGDARPADDWLAPAAQEHQREQEPPKGRP